MQLMKRNPLLLTLWLYAGWTAGAALAYILGTTDLLGPVIGVLAASGHLWLRARRTSEAGARLD